MKPAANPIRAAVTQFPLSFVFPRTDTQPQNFSNLPERVMALGA
jgi:hypothetical protein